MVAFPVCPGAIVPPVGTALHQLSAIRVVLVLHLSGLPPLLVMVTTWPVGLGSPCVLLKLRLSGEAPITCSVGGGAGWTTNITVSVCELIPPTPMQIWTEYVFDDGPTALTLTDNTTLAV